MLHTPYFFFFISYSNARGVLEFTKVAELKSIFLEHLRSFYWMLWSN